MEVPRLCEKRAQLPPMLWLVAAEDQMLDLWGEKTDVAASAVAAAAGPAVVRTLETVLAPDFDCEVWYHGASSLAEAKRKREVGSGCSSP